MSREDHYRFARQSSRDNLRKWDEDESAPSTTVRKTRQQRYSIIHAEKSPHMDFTQTPFGNDDMFNACFDDCEGEDDPGRKHERRLSRTYANNTSNVWNSDRKHSWDMPTVNGQIVKRSSCVETGLNDPYEDELRSRFFPRRNSEFFNESNRLTRSFQHELFGRYPTSFGSRQSEEKAYKKWSTRDTEFTSLSHIYPTRLV